MYRIIYYCIHISINIFLSRKRIKSNKTKYFRLRLSDKVGLRLT